MGASIEAIAWSGICGILNALGMACVLVVIWLFRRFPKLLGFMGRTLTMTMLGGVLLGYAAGIVLVLPAGCVTAPYFFGASFSLIFGAVLCKAVALSLVFNNESLHAVTFTENRQGLSVLLGTLPELGLLAAMHAVSPLREVEVSGGVVCAGDAATAAFLAALLAWHALLLVAVVRAATRSSNKIPPRFQVLRPAQLAVAVYTLCVAVVLPLARLPAPEMLGTVVVSPYAVPMVNFIGLTAMLGVLVARQLSEYVIFPHQRFITTQSQVRIATRHPRRRACPSRSCTVKSVGAQVRRCASRAPPPPRATHRPRWPRRSSSCAAGWASGRGAPRTTRRPAPAPASPPCQRCDRPCCLFAAGSASTPR